MESENIWDGGKTGGGACLYKILQSLERDDININAGRLLRIDDSVVRNIFFILLFYSMKSMKQVKWRCKDIDIFKF